MKYLFFFKGQPLLLSCVCCKIAIQDFLRGLHKKNKKIHRRSPTDIPTEYKPSVFHRELQKQLRDFATFTDEFPTDFRRLFRRQYRRTHRRVGARMYDTCPSAQLPTSFPTSKPDGITDGSRMSDTCPSTQLPTEFPTSNTDDITDGSCMSDTCPSALLPTEFLTDLPTDRKVWRDFRTFFVRISINFRRNYRRKLIAPTAINFRRKYCFIYRPSPHFVHLLLFSSSPFLFSLALLLSFIFSF